MIKFFRKIRYELMEKNKTANYLKYALGEIVLVVIGILIALQINTWNENRKLKSEELNILENFKESLKSDSIYHAESKQLNDKAKLSMDYLIEYMDKDLPYKDSLKYHFGNITIDWGLGYDFSTYEALKSKDLNLITNEDLRSELIDYYNYAENVVLGLSKRYSDIIEEASRTIFSKHFDQIWSGRVNEGSVMIPLDYKALKNDHQFRYFLKSLKNQNYWLIERPIINSNNRFEKLILAINNEIQRIKK